MTNTDSPFIRFCNWYTSLPWLVSLLLLVFTAVTLALVIDYFVVRFTMAYFPELSWRSDLNTIITTILVALPLVSFFIRLIKYLHKLRLDLLKLNTELEAANKVKNSFLSNMSHELRTPLNAILGFTEVLKLNEELELDEDAKDSLNHIIISGNHLLSLIDDILDLAKIEAGKLSISKEDISSKDMLHDSLKMIKEFAFSSGITLEITTLENLAMFADHVRCRQILLNILSNAIKYNKPNGKIFISCTRHHDFVRYSIRDTGIGLTKKQLNNLFEPFNRLGAENLHIEGSGIGLSLAKELIEAMGGKINCESEKDVGTTFTLDFPLSTDIIQPDNSDNLKATQDLQSISGKILYIEDDESNLELMRIFCNKFPDIVLITSRTGNHGLENATKNKPDLIVTDINLPDINGRQVIDALRKNSETINIPIIILTADAINAKLFDKEFPDIKVFLKPTQLDLLAAAFFQAMYNTPSCNSYPEHSE